MKKWAKKALIVAKNIYWENILRIIPNGLHLPGQPIRHIGKISEEDIYRYPNKIEKDKFEHQTCGIASLKMLTDHFGITNGRSIYEMTIESLKYRTFIIPRRVEKAEDIKGIFHDGLLLYAKSFGLVGFREAFCSLEKVVWYLNRGWIFLASIDIYQLWGGEWKDKKGGNHIVLVVGFEKNNGRIKNIFYKDIATSYKWNRETDKVDFERFNRNFNNRGIFIKFDENFQKY